MITPEDFKWLADPETKRLVEQHIDDDPVRLAFALKCERPRAVAVCSQVKYLQRCKAKLPSYYAARCIIPPVSYEQCSSEATAAVKEYNGGVCIDLTCGLGVDTYHFSRNFEKVITIERNPVLAEVARHNFALLGADNIEVVNTSAEEFLATYQGKRIDLIYVDPARRDEEKRVFLPEDCSPDVVALLPRLLEVAKRIVVKLSPLFDVKEALRIFIPHVAKLEVVSVNNECKELLAELILSPEKVADVVVTVAGKGRFLFTVSDYYQPGGDEIHYHEDYTYLLVPDVAFYKIRLIRELFRWYYPGTNVFIPSENGFCFAQDVPDGFCGRAYRITEWFDYQPKTLKKRLKTAGIRKINLLRRTFPYPSDEIKKVLGVEEGGTAFMAFTEINGKCLAVMVEPKK